MRRCASSTSSAARFSYSASCFFPKKSFALLLLVVLVLCLQPESANGFWGWFSSSSSSSSNDGAGDTESGAEREATHEFAPAPSVQEVLDAVSHHVFGQPRALRKIAHVFHKFVQGLAHDKGQALSVFLYGISHTGKTRSIVEFQEHFKIPKAKVHVMRGVATLAAWTKSETELSDTLRANQDMLVVWDNFESVLGMEDITLRTTILQSLKPMLEEFPRTLFVFIAEQTLEDHLLMVTDVLQQYNCHTLDDYSANRYLADRMQESLQAKLDPLPRGLLHRMDITPFNILTRKARQQIAKVKLSNVGADRLASMARDVVNRAALIPQAAAIARMCDELVAQDGNAQIPLPSLRNRNEQLLQEFDEHLAIVTEEGPTRCSLDRCLAWDADTSTVPKWWGGTPYVLIFLCIGWGLVVGFRWTNRSLCFMTALFVAGALVTAVAIVGLEWWVDGNWALLWLEIKEIRRRYSAANLISSQCLCDVATPGSVGAHACSALKQDIRFFRGMQRYEHWFARFQWYVRACNSFIISLHALD